MSVDSLNPVSSLFQGQGGPTGYAAPRTGNFGGAPMMANPAMQSGGNPLPRPNGGWSPPWQGPGGGYGPPTADPIPPPGGGPSQQVGPWQQGGGGGGGGGGWGGGIRPGYTPGAQGTPWAPGQQAAADARRALQHAMYGGAMTPWAQAQLDAANQYSSAFQSANPFFNQQMMTNAQAMPITHPAYPFVDPSLAGAPPGILPGWFGPPQR